MESDSTEGCGVDDTFGVRFSEQEQTAADYLDQSAFDEKFEIIPEQDYIRNLYHVENKYYLPVESGSYHEMYQYAIEYMIHPDDGEIHQLLNPDTIVERFLMPEHPELQKAECREKLVDGTWRWVQYFGIAGEENGVPEGRIYFYVYDIQNQKDRMNGKSGVAILQNPYDSLTGLRQRNLFVSAAMELAKQKQGPWCCVAIDIQHFKIFNSWYGYEKGNYLLSSIGQLLRQMEYEEDAVAAYFGRDNFAVFLRWKEDRIQWMLEQITATISSYSNSIGFLPALGVYLLENDTSISLDIYDKARLAVEEAKKNYTERLKYFDSLRFKRQQDEYRMMSDFLAAMENGEICFYIQPQCSVDNGAIVGGEALVRWIRPDGTIVSPGAFVPVLEATGFITEMDKALWEQVCVWIRSLIDRDIHPVPVSVNVSQVDLLSMDVSAYLYALTKRYDIAPHFLKVEITESTFASDFDKMNHTIGVLQEKGFKVYMDDFGNGYSSLNMLDSVKTDAIKLDMAFMQKESSLSRKGVSIVESIFSMSKSLEMPILMEGVETREQLQFLNQLGCRYVQGYYFYKPMPVKEFEALLQRPELVSYEGMQAQFTELFQAKEFLNENLFTDTMLNNILGAVAFYALEGEDLHITRYNEPFFKAIGDARMDNRRIAIQNYVVNEDRPFLFDALHAAQQDAANGGQCEVRFYKSDNSVFWFHMHFFYVKQDGEKQIFYGQIEDVTELREQSLRFFEVLREQSEITMRMNLDRNLIQYVTGESTLFNLELPSMNLDESVRLTAAARIENEEDRRSFIQFFNPNRLRAAYQKAVYHEVLKMDFRLHDRIEPIEFSTYYIRHAKDQGLIVYAFARKRDHELLELDPLTGMRNRYSYNESQALFEKQKKAGTDMIIYSLDVNGLKVANDSLGHQAGDELIRAAAEGILKVMSPYGSCFRVGGDEFVTVVYGDRNMAEDLKQELYRELDTWQGELVDSVSVSCGYVTSAECPDMDIQEMEKLADRKMYQEKSRYYQQKGIDRRLQQAAYTALCNSYTKMLKVDLTEDKFDIIRADESELSPELGYSEKISFWLQEFANSNQVHADDREEYLKKTDIRYLREYFRAGNTHYSLHYRRIIGEAFCHVLMEIITTPEYTDEQQKVFLYVKNIDA